MTDQAPIIAAIRHDGWTPARQTQFLDHLAHDGTVRAACGRVGMSREAAYQLRRREPLFARAWDAALVLARAVSAEELAARAIHGVEEDVWYKGELVGTRRKYDARLLLAHMARLDKLAVDERAEEDARRFDELLALVAGEAVPEELATDDALPLAREEAIAIARDIAADEWDESPEERSHETRDDARLRAAAAVAFTWDAWQARACAAVDRLLGAPLDGTVSGVSGVSTSLGEPAGREETNPVTVVAPVSPSPAPEPARFPGYHPLNHTYARA